MAFLRTRDSPAPPPPPPSNAHHIDHHSLTRQDKEGDGRPQHYYRSPPRYPPASVSSAAYLAPVSSVRGALLASGSRATSVDSEDAISVCSDNGGVGGSGGFGANTTRDERDEAKDFSPSNTPTIVEPASSTPTLRHRRPSYHHRSRNMDHHHHPYRIGSSRPQSSVRSPSNGSTNSEGGVEPSSSFSRSPNLPKKKQGRGPGRKDSKDKVNVSIRWDDGDLTERLISAIEGNARWVGVFAPAPQPQGGAGERPPPTVAKRDLQREIATHLFASDPRFDLADRKVLESLAVSVKNKLFKITTIYNECKLELGQIADLPSERDIPNTGQAVITWTRVRQKLPQFFRIRDIMNRMLQNPILESATSFAHHTPQPYHYSSPSTSTRIPGHHGHIGSTSSLQGPVDLPQELTYTGPSFVDQTQRTSAYNQYNTGAGLGISSAQTPTSAASTATTFPFVAPPSSEMPGPIRRTSGFNADAHGPYVSSQPSATPTYMASTSHAQAQQARQPQQQQIYLGSLPSTANSASLPESVSVGAGRSAPILGGSPSTTNFPDGMRDIKPALVTRSPIASGSTQRQRSPSPPLSETIQAIVTKLTESKDKRKAREHELEVMRLQREEQERVRWHEREMMRLRIQLIRAQRVSGRTGRTTAQGGDRGASPAPSTSRADTTVLEDELGLHAGLPLAEGDDDMSLEGDDVEGQAEGDTEGHSIQQQPSHAFGSGSGVGM